MRKHVHAWQDDEALARHLAMEEDEFLARKMQEEISMSSDSDWAKKVRRPLDGFSFAHAHISCMGRCKQLRTIGTQLRSNNSNMRTGASQNALFCLRGPMMWISFTRILTSTTFCFAITLP